MHCFKVMSATAFLLMLIFVSIIGTACSGTSPSYPPSEQTKISSVDTNVHHLLGYYRCTINPDGSIDAVYDRAAGIHVDVTPFLLPPSCKDCVSFKVLEFKPAMGHLLVAVTLKNPTPLSGYDVRGILMSDADPPHDIMNRDGYTDLWDNGGPVSRNPFIWFDNENSFDGGESKTEIFQLKMPVPPSFQFTYAVDASWPGHCKEPYKMSGWVSWTGIEIAIKVEDWQDDVSAVWADTTDLNGELTELAYFEEHGFWFAWVNNSQGLPDGEYTMWFWAESPNSQDIKLYQKLGYRVGPPLSVAEGWPLERLDIGGSGRTDLTGPVDAELKWTHTFENVTWDSSYRISPIGDSDGNIFVALPDKLTTVDLIGSETWTFATNGITGTFTPFLRGDGVIVWPVNRQLGGYDFGMLYFLNDSGGSSEMPVLLPGLVNAPAICTSGDKKILIPIGNGLFTCDFKGYPIWHYIPGDGQANVPRPAAVDLENGNYLIVTDCPGPDTEFISLNKFGNEYWVVPLNGTPLSQPILGTLVGRKYACSSAKDIPQLDKFGIQARQVNGEPGWLSPYSNYKGFTHFALAADWVLVYATGFADDLVYAVTADGGTYVGGYAPFGPLQDNISAPTIDELSNMYAGGEIEITGVRYSHFAGIQNGWTPYWTFQEEGRGFVGSPIIALDGYVHCLGLAPDNTLKLYCFGEK